MAEPELLSAEVVQEPVEPSTEAPAEEKKPRELPSYDESLLIKGKGGRVIEPKRPDTTERDTAISKLNEEIEKHSRRIKEIKEQVEASRSGRAPATGPRAALTEKLQQCRNQFGDLVRQKQRIQVENNDLKTEREGLLNESRSLRDGIRGPMDLAALEARISEAEFRLSHESLSLQDEKRLREQKEKMERHDRPAVARYTQVQQRLDAIKQARDAIRDRLQEADRKIDAVKAEREAVQAELDALRQKELDSRPDFSALHMEKQEAWEIIVALRDKITEIRTEHDAKWKQYIAQDRAYKAYSYIERQKRREQRQAEYEERQKARAEAAKASMPDKYANRIYTCDQVIAYLQKYVDEEKAAAPAAAAADPEAPAAGMKLLVKKADEELDAWFGGKGKKGKGAKKEALKQQSADTKAGGNRKLFHTIDTLKTFMQLGVTPPNLAADVPEALQKIEAKKAEFVEKQKAAAERVAAGQEPEEEQQEAAAEEAPATPEPAVEVKPAADEPTDDSQGPSTASPPMMQGIWAAKSGGSAAPASPKPAAPASPAKADADPPANGSAAPVGVSLKVSDDGELVSLELEVA